MAGEAEIVTQDEQSEARVERAPGRPREPDVDRRILNAALQLMGRDGYTRMSMDAVAAEAGVTKPTVYRRYPGKMELAIAATIAYCSDEPPVYRGETRADLVVQVNDLRHGLERPYGMGMLGTVLAEEHATPELLANFRTHLVQPRRQAIRTILERAQASGELPQDVDLDLAASLLVGSYYAQYLAAQPFTSDWAAQVVDVVLRGLHFHGKPHADPDLVDASLP